MMRHLTRASRTVLTMFACAATAALSVPTASAAPFEPPVSADFNADTHDDLFMLHSAFHHAEPRIGHISVFAMPNGFPWLAINSPESNDFFATVGASAGDVDGDGHDDIAIGALYTLAHPATTPPPNAPLGRIDVYSGATGALLWTLQHDSARFLGRSVAGVGDVNGDGSPDIAAGGYVTHESGGFYERVFVFNGSTGELIRIFVPEAPNQAFGHAITGLGDIDGDGMAELAIAAPATPFDAANGTQGRIYIFQGEPSDPDTPQTRLASLNAMTTIESAHESIEFGSVLMPGNDLNDDGLHELLVVSRIIAPPEVRGLFRAEMIDVLDGTRVYEDPPADYTGTGDVNLDLIIDAEDLNAIIALLDLPADPNSPFNGDFNGDGFVDAQDLTDVVAEYGHTHPLSDLARRPGDVMFLTIDAARNLAIPAGEICTRPMRSLTFPGAFVVCDVPTPPGESGLGFQMPGGWEWGGYATDGGLGDIPPDMVAFCYTCCPVPQTPDVPCDWAPCDDCPDHFGPLGGGNPDPGEGPPGGGGGNPPGGCLRDADCDGIPDQFDCDHPAGAGQECCESDALFGGGQGADNTPKQSKDGDGDGIINALDCDSECYIGDLEADCQCLDEDGDGTPNSLDCSSPCSTMCEEATLTVSASPNYSFDTEETLIHLMHASGVDRDGDGIPEFADGFGLFADDGVEESRTGASELFVPVVIGGLLDEPFAIGYDASDPSLVAAQIAEDVWEYTPAGGRGRLWTKPSDQERDPRSVLEGGDFVPPGSTYLIEDFVSLGSGITLYYEAITPSVFVGDHKIEVTQEGCTRCTKLTAFATTMLAATGPETIVPIQRAPISTPIPEIQLQPVVVSNLRAASDRATLLADINIAGLIRDAASDLVPGELGTIQSAQISLNGLPLTIVDYENSEISDLEVVASKPPVPQTYTAPYLFAGSFQEQFIGAAINLGTNVLTIRATNLHGHTGFASWTFTALAAPQTGSEDVSGTASLTFLPPMGQGMPEELVLSLSQWGQDFPEVIVKRDPQEPSLYVGDRLVEGGGAPASLLTDITVRIIDSPTEFQLTSIEELEVFVAHPGMAILGEFPMSLTETAEGTSEFVGPWEITSDLRNSLDVHDFSVVDSFLFGASEPGTVIPLMLGLEGPLELALAFESFRLGDWEVDFSTELHLELKPNLHAFGEIGSSLPKLFIAIDSSMNVTLDEYFASRRYGMTNYVQGIGAGLMASGADFVDGIATLGKGAWHLVANYNLISMGYRIVVGDDVILVEDQQRLDAIGGVVKSVATMTWQIVQKHADAINSALLGNPNEMVALGEEYRVAGELTAHIVAMLVDELEDWFLNLDDYELGFVVGRVCGWVLESVVTTALSGGVALATKTALFAKLAVKINRLEFPGMDSAAQDAIRGKVSELCEVITGPNGLAIKRMCFAPGTPVWTPGGPVPIERIRRGDLVLSRCERTGITGYKQVTELHRTHPDVLLRLRIAASSLGTSEAPPPLPLDGPASDAQCSAWSVPAQSQITATLVTPEHPFWSVTRGAWIAAGDLLPGEQLASADPARPLVHVQDIQVQRGPPPGEQHLTTHNLTIDGWHTYFAGDACVWVHNSASKRCQEFRAAYDARIKALTGFPLPIDRLQALREVFDALDGDLLPEDRPHIFKAIDEVVADLYNEAVQNGQVNLDLVPTYKQIRDTFGGTGGQRSYLFDQTLGPANIQIHHAAQKKYVKMIAALRNLPEPSDELLDSMPSIPLLQLQHTGAIAKTQSANKMSYHNILNEGIRSAIKIPDPQSRASAIRLAILESWDKFAIQHPGDLATPFPIVRQSVDEWLISIGLHP
ncbi:MAG: polymorphic toxin-type HINT domain-containing protein [Phycisphaerales bacterium]